MGCRMSESWRREMKEARTVLHEMAVRKAHRSWSRCCHDHANESKSPSCYLHFCAVDEGSQTVCNSAVSLRAGGLASAMPPSTKATFVFCHSIVPAKAFLSILAAVQGLLQGGLPGGSLNA